MMADGEMRELIKSIKERGQIVPCALYKGKLLDGRNRWKACIKAKVEPWTADVTAELDNEGIDPADWVIDQNKNRRHLTKSQLACVSTKYLEYLEKVGRAKMGAAGGKSSKTSGKNKVAHSVRNLKSHRSTDKAAKKVGVSGRIVQQAKRVKTTAAPEIVELVESGDISLRAAEKVVGLPKSKQAELAKRGASAVKAAAKPAAGKKELQRIFGQLVRAMDDAGISTKISGEHLEAIAQIIKAHK